MREKAKIKSQKTTWKVYLIYNSEHRRTYIGATTDVVRRLRQHRGEIVGGAKSTTKLGPNWVPICYLDGFTTQSEAYRWEKLLKLRCRGYGARIMGFVQVSLGKCPSKPGRKKQSIYNVPEGLTLMTGLQNPTDRLDIFMDKLKISESNTDNICGGQESEP